MECANLDTVLSVHQENFVHKCLERSMETIAQLSMTWCLGQSTKPKLRRLEAGLMMEPSADSMKTVSSMMNSMLLRLLQILSTG